jgi:hypothetical protein
MRAVVRAGASLALAALAAGCGSKLPEDTPSFRVGNTVVRTDSLLDVAGIVFQVADSSQVPPRGPIRRALRALSTALGDTAFALARALGPAPVSIILETWAAPDLPDSACGLLADGTRRCFSGNRQQEYAVRSFLSSARAFAPRAAALLFEDMNARARRRDLADVYVALTRSRGLDSALIAYTGYDDLRFDVTLARTFWTGLTAPSLDPVDPRLAGGRLFLVPDPTFPVRSYRSPNYVWITLGHQMAHAAVRRLLDERPDLARRTLRLHVPVQTEMARSGYTALFWNEALEEQLARAVTLRVLAVTSPTATWAARAEALNTNMALVPWLEDVLARYEESRREHPTLSAFADSLAAALEEVPLDTCRAAPPPGIALVGVARRRAVVGWLNDGSPFRAQRVLEGDTITRIDDDSVSAGGLLVPTRQIHLLWAQHLPFELGILGIRRGGRNYTAMAPINWEPRLAVRVASQRREVAGRVDGELPICRWVTRAVRPR